MSDWTKEPWETGLSGFGRYFITKADLSSDYVIASHIDTKANAKRIVECVNALASIPNPAEWMEEIKAALEQMCHCRMDKDVDASVGQEYETCPACKALALFPKEKL